MPDYLPLEDMALTEELLVTYVPQDAARFFDLTTGALRAELPRV